MIQTLVSLAKSAGMDLSPAEPRGIHERPSTAWDVVFDAFAGQPTHTGVSVSPEGSMRVSAVFACTRIIANGVAALPLILYRRGRDGSRTRATNHPVYRLLHDQANPDMTAFRFKRLMTTWVLLWGNAYALLDVEPSNGRVRSLTPWHPARVRVRRGVAGNGQERLWYTFLDDRASPTRVDVPADLVLHLRGPEVSPDGMGLSVIGQARQSLGLALAAEEYGARLFGSGASLSGVLEYPGRLSPEARQRLEESFARKYSGLANAHRVAVLEEGLKFTPTAMRPEDAQFIESRKFQTIEIARWFGVPPHMLGELDKASYASIEQQSLDFLTHTLGPWLALWETEVNSTLLSESEAKTLYAEFLVESLLRVDVKSRYEAYAKGRQWGFLSVNEIRARENLNPIAGGDQYLMPVNMTPVAQSKEQDDGSA